MKPVRSSGILTPSHTWNIQCQPLVQNCRPFSVKMKMASSSGPSLSSTCASNALRNLFIHPKLAMYWTYPTSGAFCQLRTMSTSKLGTFYSLMLDSVRCVLSTGCPPLVHFTTHTHLVSHRNQERCLIVPEDICTNS